MTTPVRGGPGSGLRVTVFHNYRDEQQPSMRLYADRLGEALERRGLQVRRVRPPVPTPEPWRNRSPVWQKLDAYLGRFVVYPRLLRNQISDINHIIDHGQAYLVGQLDARRTVVTCHDVILLALAAGRIHGTQTPPVALQLFRMSLALMKTAARVIAVSTQTKRDLVAFTGIDPDHVTVIPPGLNQVFGPNPERGAAFRKRMGFGDGFAILQIGRAFYKNLPGVLRSLQRLRLDGVDARVVRVGPPLSAGDRALAERLGITASVQELGFVADHDLPALYNAVDLLMFPSLYEGFGWPPLEAMASGTPVVSSRAGSLDEVVGDAALTADAEDFEALAWHSAAVLSNPTLRATLIQRGLERAALFDWRRTAAEMERVYADVLAEAA
jgi:glycosyltransferase involved in cell wall biosynthesis